MKKTRDSFYVALRDRLAALNPARQTVVRGVVRPGLLVEDNENFAASQPDNVFVLRWTKASVDPQHALLRVIQTCEIQYQSGGTAAAGGLDRGALMAAMDVELAAILQPAQVQKYDYGVEPALPLGTRVSWTTPAMGPLTRERDRLVRKVEVTVLSFEEEGER